MIPTVRTWNGCSDHEDHRRNRPQPRDAPVEKPEGEHHHRRCERLRRDEEPALELPEARRATILEGAPAFEDAPPVPPEPGVGGERRALANQDVAECQQVAPEGRQQGHDQRSSGRHGQHEHRGEHRPVGRPNRGRSGLDLPQCRRDRGDRTGDVLVLGHDGRAVGTPADVAQVGIALLGVQLAIQPQQRGGFGFGAAHFDSPSTRPAAASALRICFVA